MRNKIRLRSVSAGFLIGSIATFLALPAVAEDAKAPAASGGELNEIIVTANKREENINKVGMTITALGAEQLAERRITSLEDVASIVPGLVYTPSTTNTPIFTLRGVGFNESSLGVYPAVSVYQDQIVLPFPVMASHAAYDLDRVEVLKGPQGTLFGQNSTGGAINYVTAKPTPTLQGGTDISFGRFNQIDGTAWVSGPITDQLGFRLSGTGYHMDDWQISNTDPSRTNGHKSYVAGRALFDYKPADNVKLELNINAWNDTSQPQAQQVIAIHEQVSGNGPAIVTSPAVLDAIRNYLSPPFVAGASSAQLSYPFPANYNSRVADWAGQVLDPEKGTPVPGGGIVIGSARLTDFTPRSDRTFWQTSLRADIGIQDMTVTSQSSFEKFDQHQTTTGDGLPTPAYDLQRQIGYVKTFNQELRIANDPKDGSFRWLVGGNFEDSKTFEDEMLRYFANSNYYAPNLYINSSGERLSQDIRNLAGFLSLEFKPVEKLTLKASGRYTSYKIDALNIAYTQTNGNVDKLFNILGGFSGLPFTPIGPSDSYTLNSTPPSIPGGVTINSPTAAGGPLGLGIPGIPLDATLKQSNVSWRFGADYQVTPDMLTYLSVSRGYKAGSFPATAAAQYISALPVTQEALTAYEVGLKSNWLDHRIQFNAAAFYYDYKDKQVRGKLFDFVFGTLDTLVNVPKSRIIGQEFDVTVRPIDDLTVSLSGTHLNSRIQQYVGYNIFGGVNLPTFNPSAVNTQDLSGQALPYTPTWSGALNLEYSHKIGTGGSPFAGLTINAKSQQEAAIGGSITSLPVGPRYRIAPGVGLYPYMINDYATVDLRLGYESADSKWKVMLWGKNILDKYYWTAVIPSSDSSARYAGMPATFGISFSHKYE
jgi:outer membrane receptor protein involved in Fe transport